MWHQCKCWFTFNSSKYLTGYLSHPHTAQSILGSILASCCWWMLTSMAFSTFTVDAGIIRGYAQKRMLESNDFP